MAENIMSFANENVTRGTLAFDKAGSKQSARSPKRAQAVRATHTDTTKSPLMSRSKPKQPFLRRGTGLQNRLTSAKHKRYVPKGGFIKGQAEGEGVQLQDASAADTEDRTHTTALSSQQNQSQRHDRPKEMFEAADVAESSSAAEQYMASEAKPASPKHGYGRFAPPHQADGFSAAQFHTNADTEAELDADTALVHFPLDDQGRRAQANYKQQGFQDSFNPKELQQMPEISTQKSVAELNHLNSLAGPHAATGVPDWQVQQAAEAMELEEFRALERQITQDNRSVRGSTASLSSVPAWPRHSSTAVRKSMGLNHMSQQHQLPHAHAMHRPERHHSVRSQLSETNELLFEHAQGVRQAAQQRPQPRVTGNPFADPEEGSDHDDDSHSAASATAQQEPKDSHSPATAPLHACNVSEHQQPSSCRQFGAESAWDAISAAAAPLPHSSEGSQDTLQAENPSQKYIQQMFRRQQPQAPAQKPSSQPQEMEAAAVAALEQEMKALKDDRAHLSKLRTQLEQASVRMEQETAAWKLQQSDEAAAWEADKEAENQRLKRHQRVLDKQSRALLKLPNRKERSEVEAVEAVLEQERKASNAKDARHKLTVERLRQKLVELQSERDIGRNLEETCCSQDTNAELREEIQFHEQRRLEEWNAKENQQPQASSRGKADRLKRSEAAAGTSRSNKIEQPSQEASSQPAMRPAQSILQDPPGKKSQAHAPSFDEAQHMAAAGMYQASAADGVPDDGNDNEADAHTIYREDAGPLAEQWQQQSQESWMQESVAQHGQGVSVLPSGHRTEHEWQTSLQAHQDNLHVSQLHAGRDALQGMQAFQPVANLRLPSTSNQNPASAFTGPQQARQPAKTPADRYQHATVLASPDDFVWQPIRPQTGQRPEQRASRHDHVAASQAASMADMADIREPTWMTHVVPPSQSGQYSRSLRESLDAAARLDSRLQLAQQDQQQQQSQWPMHQWHPMPEQTGAAGRDTVGSSTSWQNLQDPFAAGHPTAPQHAALRKQQPLGSSGAQAQREAMPLIDRSGSQIADPLPGHQAQYHMLPKGHPSDAWLSSHAAEPHALLEAQLYDTRRSGSQGSQELDSWVTEGGPAAAGDDHSSTEQTGHEDQHPAASSGKHGEALGPEPGAGADPQRPYQELNYPDGKVEQVFSDGRRSVLFANGTRKQQFPDGHTAIRFTNSDIKRFFPCGRVEYYYCEVDTWHTTHANGIEVFYFPNGQTEAHHPSGTKEIIFPDGIIRRVFTDGREQDVTPEQLSSPVKHPVPEDKD